MEGQKLIKVYILRKLNLAFGFLYLDLLLVLCVGKVSMVTKEVLPLYSWEFRMIRLGR